MFAFAAAVELPEIMEIASKAGPGEFQHSGNTKLTSLSNLYAAFAKSEIEKGFPILHVHALVALWGLLEAAIEDALVAFLLNEPDRLRNEPFGKLKITLADFEASEKDDRMRLLLAELERDKSVRRRHGVDRFEVLLEAFGFSAPVHPLVKKELYALHHIRNVIVHRGSLADRRLVQACPWLSLKIGEPIIVTHKAYARYDSALAYYVLKILERFRAHFGLSELAGPDSSKCTEENEESIFNDYSFYHFLHHQDTGVRPAEEKREDAGTPGVASEPPQDH